MDPKTAEFLEKNSQWYMEFSPLEDPRELKTVRFIDGDVPQSGPGYRWDIDDNYDLLIEELLGVPEDARLELQLDGDHRHKQMAAEVGMYTLNLEVDGFYVVDLSGPIDGSVRHIPHDKMGKLNRVDEFFARMGSLTLPQFEEKFGS